MAVEMKKCATCGGNGECHHCHGSEHVPSEDTTCAHCDGSGTCAACDGSGEIEVES